MGCVSISSRIDRGILNAPLPTRSLEPMDKLTDLSPSEVLEQMHKDLKRTLYNAVRYGVPKKDRKTGKVTLVKPSVQLMNIARQFTRDNSAEPNKVTSPLPYFNT